MCNDMEGCQVHNLCITIFTGNDISAIFLKIILSLVLGVCLNYESLQVVQKIYERSLQKLRKKKKLKIIYEIK
jgi:hypothetical protein